MSNADHARAVAILKVTDINRTIAWWTAIGFRLRGHHPPRPQTPTWCELERDGFVIQFLAGETPWSAAPCFTGALYVRPASVAAVYDEIRGKVVCEWGVEEREWGSRELVLRDPDGYYVTFTEPMYSDVDN
jgi:catechol 2,3-dioxygenase-like lactoylglutathione lyase family enzyme